jgi:hypothetical protein
LLCTTHRWPSPLLLRSFSSSTSCLSGPVPTRQLRSLWRLSQQSVGAELGGSLEIGFGQNSQHQRLSHSAGEIVERDRVRVVGYVHGRHRLGGVKVHAEEPDVVGRVGQAVLDGLLPRAVGDGDADGGPVDDEHLAQGDPQD